ncbi:leucine-zipper-like transcriptional regulator 1 homolog isoform X2 [Denticeps clupeoides]|uniref:Uncharacterized protein n=1 Tax=Denticeps clupeoides TaxID=299321 RepID=A0AAY4C6J9_9TELE|nr:leucine-zipper-like transcriptional regulator 1 homolog isoform X2 [Denticeps clupeoides]
MHRHSGAGVRSMSRPCLWNQRPQGALSPCNRYKHAACAHRGHVYLLGGRGLSLLKDLWRYSVVTDEWNELDCTCEGAPEELEEHSMVAHKGLLYVFGGMIDSAYTSWKTAFWVFNTIKGQWELFQGQRHSPQRAMPVNRKAHSAVVMGSAMYIYGGYIDMRGSSQELWEYDFDTRVWSLLSGAACGRGPGPRHGHSAMAHQHCMYLYGGLSGLREQRDLWKWNTTSQAWSCIKAPSGPSKLVGHSAVVYRDSMLIFGGGETQDCPTSSLWRFDLTAQSWEKLYALHVAVPPSRIHHCSVGFGPSFQQACAGPLREGSNNNPSRPQHVKNKLCPFAKGDIELKTLSSDKKTLKETDFVLAGSRLRGTCMTFRNEDAFSEPQESEGTAVDSGDSVDQQCPDVLLILGGRPLGGQPAISVWQMTLSD